MWPMTIERLGARLELTRHGDSAHEAIVGVECHTKAKLAKKIDGCVTIETAARMHVRGGTHLKWDATVANEVASRPRW